MNEPTLEHYETMVRLRAFDEACLQGVPTFEIHGELHTGIGQEAIAAGMASSLRAGDAVVSTHRNHYHALVKGVSPRSLMAEIFERETGLCGGFGGHMHPFDPARNFSATGIVGASLPVALGYAYAFKLRAEPYVAVGITGDGGANHGTFHECLNMAAAWKLPFVVLVENNEYAISVRASEVTATPTIAERAAAYGSWGRRVDGTEVCAVEEAFAEAMAHAREGHGPALLEATCYRFRGHYEGDHDSYRPRAERNEKRAGLDPLKRCRERLLASRTAHASDLDAIDAEARQTARAMLESVRADKMPDASLALKHVLVGASP